MQARCKGGSGGLVTGAGQVRVWRRPGVQGRFRRFNVQGRFRRLRDGLVQAGCKVQGVPEGWFGAGRV